MAEKEERILIKKENNYHPPYGGWRGDGKEIVLTRHESVCKIARAICRAGGNECIGDCESCDLWEVGPEKDYAEAALNALLEDK